MQGAALKARHVVDPEAAKLLLNPRALRFLEPFMLGPATLTSAAKRLSVRPSAVSYWLPKFLAADLVRPCRQDASHGPGRWYRSSAQEFRLSGDVLAVAADEAIVASGRRRAINAFYTALALNTAGLPTEHLVVMFETNHVTLRSGLPTGHRVGEKSTIDGWLELRLSHERARDLKNRLNEIIREATAQTEPPTEAGQAYLVHFGLTELRSP